MTSYQSSLAADFGAIGDGQTDNVAAWMRFNAFATAESVAGRGVDLRITPGVYNFDHSKCYGFLFGIKKLRIIGYGAVLQNTYDPTKSGPNFGFELALSSSCAPNLFGGIGPLIRATAVGDTQVTLLTPAQVGQFAVNDWVMVSSLDIQYYGYPPNCDLFDFVQISAIDPIGGVISFSGQLNNAHRSDFSDGGNPNPCGKARIWQLSQPGIPWDIDHVYEGLEIRKAPNSTLTYMTMVGRSWKAINCVLPGCSPSVAQNVELRGGVLTDVNEPDKLVSSFLIDGVHIKKGITFQSSSIDCVTIRNSKIDGFLQAGQAKQFLAQNCDTFGFTEGSGGQQYGTGRGVVVEACRIRNMPYASALPNVAQLSIPVDGVNVSYAKGVFSLLNTGNIISEWGITRGSMINVLGPSSNYSGSQGCGFVTGLTENATHILVETTCPWAALPAWATGVWIVRHGAYTMRDCSGCDVALAHSRAAAKGKKHWEYFQSILAGNNYTGVFNDHVGDLLSVTAKVIQPYAGPGAMLTLSFTALDVATMSNPLPYSIYLDMTVVGTRKFNQCKLQGKAAADSVSYGGAAQRSLVPGIWVMANGVWNYNNMILQNPSSQFPVVDLTLEFDTGIVREFISL